MKLKYLIIASLSIVALSSCKKDYTCECTHTIIDGNGNVSTSTSVGIINDTKKNAQTLCESNFTATLVCELK